MTDSKAATPVAPAVDVHARAREAWESDQRMKRPNPPGPNTPAPADKKAVAADAAKDILAQAATGAAKGAVVGGGVPGAVVGGVKSAGVALVKNKTTRNWLIALATVILAIAIAVPLGLVFLLMTAAASAGPTGDQQGSLVSTEASGVDADTVASAISAASNGVSWQLALAVQQARNAELTPDEYVQLATALENAGFTLSNGLNLIPGAVYDSAKSESVISKEPALKAAQDDTKKRLVQALVAFGLPDTQANSVYQQALIWTLGQVNGCGAPGAANAAVDLDSEQMTNVVTIIGVAKTMFGAADQKQAALIGIATARQESALRNINYGDLDSIGLFQQRAGWGTAEQRIDPVYASAAFFQELAKVPGWQTMPVTEAAQAVQVSAFPDLYAQWEPLAKTLVSTQFASSPAVNPPAGFTTANTGGGTVTVSPGNCQGGPLVKPLLEAYTISDYFGPRESPGGIGSTFHQGIDMNVAGCSSRDVAIVAVAAGTVTTAGYDSSAGNWVQIDHGGWTSQYMHMVDGSLKVAVGDSVTPGQQLGVMGTTGGSTGCHLHFGVVVDGLRIDPMPFMFNKGVNLEP